MRVASLVIVAALLVGCGNQAQYDKALADTRAALAQAKDDIADLQAAADKLPAGKDRDAVASALAKAETVRAGLESKVAAVEALNVAAKAGDTSGVGAAVSSAVAGVPYVGPYAPLIGVAVGIGYGIWQRRKRTQEATEAAQALSAETTHLTNIVRSLEVAGPEWTEQDKQAIAAVQGQATSLRVDELKAGL